MIVTVTANPSLDRTVQVRKLVRGGLNRASSIRVDPGGKGINVARALAQHGVDVRAVVAAGGIEGQQLVALLAGLSIDVLRVPAVGPVRINMSVVEPDATVTKFNEPGALLDAGDARALCEAVLRSADGANWVVIAGSLPPGVSSAYYAGLIRMIGSLGVPVVVDTSGPALHEAVQARPALVKPNLRELEETVGHSITTIGGVVDAADEILELGADTVLASLGADGALLRGHDGCGYAEAPVTAQNAVGAGDALLAGYLSEGCGGLPALVTAVAWGAAAASLPGSAMPQPHDLRPDLVRVESRVPWDRRLHRDP
ncbi:MULTISPECIES: 1-phosphofructokinase family hexose kinase [Saccharopolyspora]|uniref:1-phosphofructokinase family hexose kinase n=1 Tax=Saccharopolyspora TaxID=1835 RepID=UPI001CD3D9B6|nr:MULTISPECIES: 1-phosphofructokinase family hexose kinase [unclassified Saccharopolyspora]MCA1186017.1 1-phosphofructokinase family hexose kinase [Saccharopolyspora sp. 6T]MCA1192397.1 1-phosphofructokinase family hexose kinase [Saccharopolyspora sp. 6V]MCA1229923.1 1-phosphofructokinase family hexose kinase [Saccharopolyspora sp. 6M]MCA1280046.1 1-phosphofructokinase family hexose kinase [Saccharopolyspora sp. 7B]